MKSGPKRPDGSRLLRQLAEAVHYLHQRGLVHRDIKLENVLLDSDGNAKLVDFGFARFMAPVERSTSFCGTRPYAAPELHLRKAYEGTPVDWYALGAVLFAALVGKMPFVSDLAALSSHIVYPDSASPSTAARDVVRTLLEPDPIRRAGYDECVQSAWLRDEQWTWTNKDIVYEAIQ
jgi:serine/threonine protein kinase